jgi:uncharacterized protein YjbI with pentapeptide repeats
LARLGHVQAHKTDFRGANLFRADCQGADFVEADFRGTCLKQTDLRNAEVRLARIDAATQERSGWSATEVADFQARGAVFAP